MVLRFMESFDDFTSTANGSIKWNSFSSSLSVQSTTARNGNAVKATNANQAFTKTLDNQQTWIVGFAFQVSTLANSFDILLFRDNGTNQCSLWVNTNGTLQVFRSSTTALDSSGTSSNSILTNTWYYIEWKLKISNSISSGDCQVNVNGVNWINVNAGQSIRNSANNQANELQFLNNSNLSANIFFDDMYVLDGTGSSNNAMLGDSKVEALTPNGAGNYSQFTSDTGTNYTRVNEANPDGDTSYVQSSTVNNIDTYTFSDLSSTPNSIAGIMINTWAKKTDAGARQFANLIRISSTDYLNANNFSPSDGSYIDFTQTYDTDPSTSAAWGATNVNGMEVGFKLTT